MADIVINISRITGAVSRDTFSVPIILANTAHTYEQYVSLAEVELDFSSSTTVYKMASALFSQEIKPAKIAIAGVAYTEDVNVTSETLTLVSGSTYSFANGYIKVGSILGLEANSVPIPDANIVSIDYINGTITFTAPQTPPVTVDEYKYHNDPAGFTTLLNQLYADEKEFYGIVTEGSGYRLQKEIDTWVSTAKALYAARTSVSPDDYPETLSVGTAMYYHETLTEYADATVFGKCLPKDPGSLSWANQVLTGITPNILTGSELTALKNKRWNTIVRQYGYISTNTGYLCQSLYIDQRRMQHWVEVNMLQNVANVILVNDKIDYTNEGIGQVAEAVNNTLNEAFRRDIVSAEPNGSASFSVYIPSITEIPQIDIDNRELNLLTFQYVERSKIENATITGTIVPRIITGVVTL